MVLGILSIFLPLKDLLNSTMPCNQIYLNQCKKLVSLSHSLFCGRYRKSIFGYSPKQFINLLKYLNSRVSKSALKSPEIIIFIESQQNRKKHCYTVQKMSPSVRLQRLKILGPQICSDRTGKYFKKLKKLFLTYGTVFIIFKELFYKAPLRALCFAIFKLDFEGAYPLSSLAEKTIYDHSG